MHKLRIIYSKENDARFIPFNYLSKVFERIFRRFEVPFLFSEGFSKRIKISLGPAIPVGLAGKNEVLDIVLAKEISLAGFKEKINKILPVGLEIKECFYTDPSDRVSSVKEALYLIKKTQDVKSITGQWEILNDTTETITIKTSLANLKHKILFEQFGIENIIERTLILPQVHHI